MPGAITDAEYRAWREKMFDTAYMISLRAIARLRGNQETPGDDALREMVGSAVDGRWPWSRSARAEAAETLAAMCRRR